MVKPMRKTPRYPDLSRRARHALAKTLRSLPKELRETAAPVPVLFYMRPSKGLQQEGIALDTLGLFTGSTFAETVSTPQPMPPQIFLFLGNLWLYTRNWPGFLKEVRTTYLHELGHYLNLEEDDLYERGLE